MSESLCIHPVPAPGPMPVVPDPADREGPDEVEIADDDPDVTRADDEEGSDFDDE